MAGVETRADEEGGAAASDARSAAARAERARRARHLDEAVEIARGGAPGDLPARLALAVALLERGDVELARDELVESLERWAAEAQVDLSSPESVAESPPAPAAHAGIESAAARAAEIEAIDEGEWDAALESAVPEVDQMHDVNRVAERVLMDEPEGLAEVDWEGHDIDFNETVGGESASLDAAEAPSAPVTPAPTAGRARVLATLEVWLGNVRRERRAP